MTREAVFAALEEVRPYLQADGGDVEIVGVEDGYVSLRLEGACRCDAGGAPVHSRSSRGRHAAQYPQC
jgi:Fe-S cluster biogenesis protein NfuA